MMKGYAGGWCLFFLAAMFPGDGSAQAASRSELHSEAPIYQPPVLRPSETTPPTGTYVIKDNKGNPCIKATMGAEYIVLEKKKTWYFNLEPSRVISDGKCDKDTAVLTLTLPGNATSLQFTFRKEKSLVYVSKLTAYVSPLPVCQGCANKTYSGLMANVKLFGAADGKSFKCKSESLLMTSSVLNVRLVPLQMQAFSVPKEQYGKEVECWADFDKRVIPIMIGATVVTICLIAVLTYLFIRDRPRQGYNRF
ncbi:lysosome-associated membrane glycoprotein 3 [Thunnus albacares]|uniref:lysosome-associated membrane glycoprotein 3 n=1 Tax=Thunnus albacares TaxID=8236 RepID=UPI001CF6A543|nr:lysosome-associated membrane glycoprotein 3 [Thunnus albacares]